MIYSYETYNEQTLNTILNLKTLFFMSSKGFYGTEKINILVWYKAIKHMMNRP